MDKTIVCFRCRKEFIPDEEYEFPNFYVYWHKCLMGCITQNIVMKEKKRHWWTKPELTTEQNVNRNLMFFHDPWMSYGKLCAKTEEDQ